MLTNPGKAFIVTTVPSVKCREQDTTSPNTAFRKPPVVRDGSKERGSHPLRAAAANGGLIFTQ